MPGFTTDFNDVSKTVVYADNVDFSGGDPVEGKMLNDGELLIGASTDPRIRVSTLTAGTGINILNGDGSITISSQNQVFYYDTLITSAQLLSLSGVYLQLLPTLPAGQIYILHGLVLQYNYNSIAYGGTAGGDIFFYADNIGNLTIGNNSSAGFLDQVENAYILSGFYLTGNYSPFTATVGPTLGCYISNIGANWTNGNGTVTSRVYYQILNIPI